MVERLNRQWRRPIFAEAFHALEGYARAHLEEAIEAAPARPGTGPAIGIERYVDGAGPNASPRLRSEPKPFERVWPIAMNDDIGAGQKLKQSVSAARIPQIEPGAPLAERHFWREAWLIPFWWVYPQHISPEAREAFIHYIGLRKAQPLFSNARSIRNALDRMRLRQANRLVADLDRVLTADDIMSLEASDVLASRVFSRSSVPEAS